MAIDEPMGKSNKKATNIPIIQYPTPNKGEYDYFFEIVKLLFAELIKLFYDKHKNL